MKITRKIIFLIFGFALLLILIGSNYFNVYAVTDHQVNGNFTYTYTTTCDDPITLEELITEIDLNAYDGSGNNITSSIVVSNPGSYIVNVLNQPSSYSVILGNYQVVYAVYDKYGNHNTCAITISVVDNQAPVIDEASIAVLEINKLEVTENTFELIKRGIIVSDNHDYELDYEFEKDFELESAIGFNRVNLYVSDQSGNRSSIAMEITIYDTVGPKIYADNTYIKTTDTSNALTFDEIVEMCNITSIDLETNTACEIEVNYDNYTENYNKNGVYMIRAFAQDEEGNRTNFYIYIEVVDTAEPVFFLSSTKLTITTKVSFDLDRADELIRSRKMARSDNYTLSVEKDEYTINKETAGTYIYQVKATYEDDSESLFEFIITVEEEIKEIIDDEPLDEITLKEKMSKTINVLWKVAKWPFEKLGKFFKEQIFNRIIKKSLLFKK